MSSLAVKEAAWGILTASWTETRIVDFENLASDVNASMAPWVSLQFGMATEDQIGLGDEATRYWREEGFVHVLIAVPSRSGWKDCDTFAKKLGILFRGKQVTENLVFRGVTPPRLYTQSEAVLGNWLIKASLVDYMYTYPDPT